MSWLVFIVLFLVGIVAFLVFIVLVFMGIDKMLDWLGW